MRLRVIEPGARTLIEDGGRPGLAALGVSPSGAADRGAYRLANRLLGNDEAAATLEVFAGGLELVAESPTMIAVTGAPVSVTVGGRAAAFEAPLYVGSGQRIVLGRPERGLRSYLAVAGGIVVPQELGSRSADTIAGLGPAPLAAGDVLVGGADALSAAVGHDGQTTAFIVAAGHSEPPTGTAHLAGTWGPRADWFTEDARRGLCAQEWQVSGDSDRVGVRCSGASLNRSVDGELPSEAMVRGSVQVPTSGQPVIFLADHPTTGGYPVIAVLDEAAVDVVAQLRPGDVIRFDVTDPPYPIDLPR